MTKVSPIAAYLCANKARTIKEGNIKRFVSPEGLYLGYQKKSVQNGAVAYSIEIFSGLKKMFFQTTVLGQEFAYITNPKAKQGVSVMPVKTYIFRTVLDFINNTMHSTQTTRVIKNELTPIAIFENGALKFDKDGPFKYEEFLAEDKVSPFKKDIIRYHFDQN